jgi:hypothetical protein
VGALLVVSIGLLFGHARVFAQGPNPHFDALIAELQARSAAYTNVEDKVEMKKKKTVDKVIASFFKKPSVSLVTDLKLAGKAAMTLAKTFPEEFTTNGTTMAAMSVLVLGEEDLSDLLQVALDAFGGDIDELLAAAQDLLNTAPAGSCRDKAQVILEDVAAQLALAGTALNLPTAAKILGTAAKNVLKGQSAATAAIKCSSGGSGKEWYDWLLGMTVDGTPVSAYQDARNNPQGPDLIFITYYSYGTLSVSMSKQGSAISVDLYANVGNPASGTHTLSGSYGDSNGYYSLTSGTITITKWPSSFPGRGEATFSFTATGTAGTVNVTAGSFSVWIYPPY